MMTIEIKIDGNIREVISVRYIAEPANNPASVCYEPKDFKNVDFLGEYEYLVNETYKIKHRRGEGHRELARKALEAVRKAV